jgi:hypothetical protein
MKTCLLLICKDGKQILTDEKNYVLLAEFIDTFNIQTQFIKIEDDNILLDMHQIARIFTDSNYTNAADFISKTSADSAAASNDCINTSAFIRKKIKETLIKNGQITFKEICTMFENLNYSLAALNNHFKIVRQECIAGGWEVTKIKNGLYKIQKP